MLFINNTVSQLEADPLNSMCKCHPQPIQKQEIMQLKQKGEILQRACREGDEKAVRNFIIKEAATGALDYLLAGLRSTIHGTLLKNKEIDGLEWNHTASPVWVALFNKHVNIAVILQERTELQGVNHHLKGLCNYLEQYTEEEMKNLPAAFKLSK